MSGGNWTDQNKILPGVYINYKGQGNNPSVVGDRGTVALPLLFPWLAEQQVIKLDAASAIELAARHESDSLLIREAAKKAKTILLYRLNKGVAATADIGTLTATAIYSGVYGNRLSVSVAASAGTDGAFDVVTWLDTTEVNRQTVTGIGNLVANGYVTFSGSGDLTESAGIGLAGGTDGIVTTVEHVKALAAFETYEFDAIACPFSDVTVKALYAAYAKRLVADEGKYIQAVLPDYPSADFEAVISVKNGVVLEDGTAVSNAQATAYVAGATAACALNGSLTNADYTGATDVDVRFTKTEQEELARGGQLVFLPPESGKSTVTIQKDINTLTTFSDTKTYALSKNKVIRDLYAICTNIAKISNLYFKGKVTNNADGRALLKAKILEYFRDLEQQQVLQDVVPEDITVEKGKLADAVVVSFAARIPDVMEMFYNSITVEA